MATDRMRYCRSCHYPIAEQSLAEQSSSPTPVRQQQQQQLNNGLIWAVGITSGIFKLVGTLIGIGGLVFGIWSYHHSRNVVFQLECADQQAHYGTMPFPDNIVCDIWG